MSSRQDHSTTSATAPPLIVSAAHGARLGLLVALFAATLDVVDTLWSGFEGQVWARGAYVYSSLVLVLGAVGAALGAWTALVLRTTEAMDRWRELARAVLLGLPGGAFMAWVPTSWIVEHSEELEGIGVAVAASVYPLALAASTILAALTRRWVRSSPHGPRSRWLLLGCLVALAGGSYWADRTVLVGLYDDFHAGLSVMFLSAIAASAAVALQSLAHAPRLERLSPAAVALCLTGCAVTQTALESVELDAFGPSSSVIFDKLAATLRESTDFDDDGYSHLYGGSDCEPLNAEVRPGKLDLPGDDVDDDCSGTAAAWPDPAPQLDKPGPELAGYHVLLITIDALRADHVGAWGYSRNPTTPNLDSLAARSIRFARAFSPAPKTYDTLPALVTGLYPVNVPRNYKAKMPKGQPKKPYLYRITDDVTLLPEVLQRSGYVTGAAHGVSILRALGLDRGFDEYQKTREPTEFARDFLRRNVLEAARANPFFLWLHYYSPHHTYKKRQGFDFGDQDVDRYDSEIAYDDHQIGLLLDELSRTGLSERTVIIVTSDHGEEFGEHGGFQHGFKLYSELTHVPLLVSIPGQPPAVVQEPVELVDVAPTLCSLLSVAEHCGEQDGHNLLAALAGTRPAGRGAYSELYRKNDLLLMNSLYTGEWRAIFDYKADRVELYDVVRDPREQTNVATAHPRLVRKLRDQIATRTLYRQGLAFAHYEETRDTLELAKRLPVFRRRTILRLALRHIEDDLRPAHTPYLERLLERPGLHRSDAKLVRKLLARLEKAQQKPHAGRERLPPGQPPLGDSPAVHQR